MAERDLVRRAEGMLRNVEGAYGTLVAAKCSEHGWKSRTRDPNNQYAGHHVVRWSCIEDAMTHLRKKHGAEVERLLALAPYSQGFGTTDSEGEQ